MLHEIAHILLKHVDADHSIVEEIDDSHSTQDTQEKEDDGAAGRLLFPSPKLRRLR
ncbi:MAG: hypothetical protein ACRDU4_16330 [Mycobacterium sp.]